MQTNCPNCSNRLVLDDAKVPDTPFMLKCPKCQNTIKLPGKNGGGEAAPPPQAPAAQQAPQSPQAPPAAAPPAEAPPAAAPASGAAPAAEQAPAASSSVIAPPAPVHPPPSQQTIGKVLASFPAAEQATTIGTMLAKLGFATEGLDPHLDEKVLRLQQGEYAVVATSRNGVPAERDLYRIVRTLPPDIRRRVFLILVGDEFKTAEGTQAFAVLADLVLHSSDVPNAERIVAQAMIERRRVYQTFWDAEERKAEGKL